MINKFYDLYITSIKRANNIGNSHVEKVSTYVLFLNTVISIKKYKLNNNDTKRHD